MTAEASTMRGKRDRSRSSARAAMPMWRVPHHSCAVIAQPAMVVPQAAVKRGESACVYVLVRNGGPDTITLWGAPQLSLRVRVPDGRVLDAHPRPVTPDGRVIGCYLPVLSADRFVWLRTGCVYGYAHTLSFAVLEGELRKRSQSRHLLATVLVDDPARGDPARPLPVGEYRLRARLGFFQTAPEHDLPAWTGYLVSGEAAIELEPGEEGPQE